MEITRRHLLGGIAALGASGALPESAFSQPREAPRLRIPWSRFAEGPHLGAFKAAFTRLRTNKDRRDPDSILYWAEAHYRDCPHGEPYFLAWHRSFLGLFEEKLRELGGSPGLTLPYWDYYSGATIPGDFTDGDAPTNPLFMKRVKLDVSEALGSAAFDDSLTRFERDLSGRHRASFEAEIEQSPHNQVHSLIGEIMSSYHSPEDPVFWLHHCNIDRLWSAWVAAGGGRTMPAAASSYWAGRFDHGPLVGGLKSATIDTVSRFGYDYDDTRLPTRAERRAPARPRAKSVVPGTPLRARRGFTAVGRSTPLVLGENSFSVNLPLAPPPAARRAALAAGFQQRDEPAAAAGAATYDVVLDDVTFTEKGKRGGYFYDIYVNLPAVAGGPKRRHRVGSIAPFSVATGAAHASHGEAAADAAEGKSGAVRLVFPATTALRGVALSRHRQVSVSFVRAGGKDGPSGPVMEVGDFRIESAAAVET
ncbi:MAG TPA: tyrosinase family protein [Allosphingosinicella sp.]|jgi:tyrosinase